MALSAALRRKYNCGDAHGNDGKSEHVVKDEMEVAWLNSEEWQQQGGHHGRTHSAELEFEVISGIIYEIKKNI